MASVRERVLASGEKTWVVLFRHGSKQSSKTFRVQKKAAEFVVLVEQFGPDRALQLIKEDRSTGTGQSLDGLAEKWLAAKEGDVTPLILTGYRRDYYNWISPWLGHREAASIHEGDVQRLVDHMKTRLSPKSVADRHAILHQLYKWGGAKSRGHVTHNPCKETELPKRVKTLPKGLRLPELHALLSAGERIDPDAADLIAFMSSTGWRISEAVALTAGAIEDDGTTVYVTMERVLRREVGFTPGGKSQAALRRLRVIGPGVAVLRRRAVGLAPGDLVFTFADGRPGVNRRKPWNVNSFRDIRWPRIIKEAGLSERKPTPHWLRHTHVAVCHAAGISLAEIQRRLGHEDIQTTINIYGRMIDDMSDEAAARLEVLLTPATPQVVQGMVVADSGIVAGPVETDVPLNRATDHI